MEQTDSTHPFVEIEQTTLMGNICFGENVSHSCSRQVDSSSYQPLITDEEMWYLNVYVNGLGCGMVALFGTGNNIINMIIFFELGLSDSMSICLFALALTDFLLSFVVFTSRVFPIWDTFFSTDVIDPMAIWHAGPDWLSASLFSCSGWITTYLAMERCVCVTFPFKVKEIFTRKRSIIVVTSIFMGSAAVFIPIYVTHWLEWVHVEVQVGNRTRVHRRLVLTFADGREKIFYYVDILCGYILPFSSLFLLVGSVFWMIYGLRRSSKLRDHMTAKSKTDNTGPRQNSKLTHKTRKLVKAVLVLAIIFTACTIPLILSIHLYLVNPEIQRDGKERNLFHFMFQFTNFAATVNSSVNIFVYLAINTSYRAKFKELMSCKKGRNKKIFGDPSGS